MSSFSALDRLSRIITGRQRAEVLFVLDMLVHAKKGVEGGPFRGGQKFAILILVPSHFAGGVDGMAG